MEPSQSFESEKRQLLKESVLEALGGKDANANGPQGKGSLANAPRVLVFHEDKESRHDYLAALGACGVKISNVSSVVPEAVNELISSNYDLILVSFQGKDAGAEHFIDEVKSLEATAEIPIIAISGDSRTKTVLRIRSKGVSQVLVMPLTRKMVQDAVSYEIFSQEEDGPVAQLHRAQSLLREGDLEEAETIFTTLSKTRSLNEELKIEAKIGLASIRLGRQEFRAAVDLLKDTMRESKTLSSQVEQYRLLALVYHNLGDYFFKSNNYEQSVKHYQAALKLNPFYPETLPNMLQVIPKVSSIGNILDFLDEISENFAPYSEPINNLASSLNRLIDLYRTLNLHDNIELIFDHLLKVPHYDVDLHQRVTTHLLGQRRFCEAREYLEVIIARLKDVDLLNLLADLYVDVGRDYVSERAQPKAPGEGPEPQLDCFAEENFLGLIQRAAGLYQESLMLEPYESRTWLRLACCHLWRSEKAEAQGVLTRFVESVEVTSDMLAEIGDTLLAEKAYELAGPYIKDGVERYPNESRFYRMEARLHSAVGDHYKAITSLKRGLQKSQRDVECIVDLATVYVELTHWDDAVEFYEKAVKLKPDDSQIAESLRKTLRLKYQASSSAESG